MFIGHNNRQQQCFFFFWRETNYSSNYAPITTTIQRQGKEKRRTGKGRKGQRLRGSPPCTPVACITRSFHFISLGWFPSPTYTHICIVGTNGIDNSNVARQEYSKQPSGQTPTSFYLYPHIYYCCTLVECQGYRAVLLLSVSRLQREVTEKWSGINSWRHVSLKSTETTTEPAFFFSGGPLFGSSTPPRRHGAHEYRVLLQWFYMPNLSIVRIHTAVHHLLE